MRLFEASSSVRALLRSAAPLILSAVVGGCVSAPVRNSVPAEPTIAQVREDLQAGRYNVRVLERHYEERIAAIDHSGPMINAVIELNPDAPAIAATLDGEPGPHGPLFGIPVLLKDNIDTADHMLTTAGSLALVNSAPVQDAFIVKRMRASGLLILGKTNLSEWANFRSTRATSGWSGRGGQTKHPYSTAIRAAPAQAQEPRWLRTWRWWQ